MPALTKRFLLSVTAVLSLLTLGLIIPWQSQAQTSFPDAPQSYWNWGTRDLPSGGQGDIQHCTLNSQRLKSPYNTVGFNVYTPPSYSANSSQNYPVIYLLHGINGSEYNYFSWFNNTTFFNAGSGSLPSLMENGQANEAILVFVNGGKASFYDDWDDSTGNGPSSSFPVLSESVIMDELIPFVDANFRTIASRNGRAIEGFSMGGRGAVKLAFTYPDQFCSAIAYAGAAYEEVPLAAGASHPRFGPMTAPYRLSTIAANQASAILANNLQIRLVDGAGDGAAGMGGGSAALSPQLTSLGIGHQFVPSQSGVTDHNWFEYHQATGATGLDFHFTCFATAVPFVTETVHAATYLPLITQPNSTATASPTTQPLPPTSTETATAMPGTATATNTATAVATLWPTLTATFTATFTPTSTATFTLTPTATSTATPTMTATITTTPTATATRITPPTPTSAINGICN
ncbi:MAG: alpha/beta hydrolase-fold protein [Chloroflexota bacterium]